MNFINPNKTDFWDSEIEKILYYELVNNMPSTIWGPTNKKRKTYAKQIST